MCYCYHLGRDYCVKKCVVRSSFLQETNYRQTLRFKQANYKEPSLKEALVSTHEYYFILLVDLSLK